MDTITLKNIKGELWNFCPEAQNLKNKEDVIDMWLNRCDIDLPLCSKQAVAEIKEKNSLLGYIWWTGKKFVFEPQN